MNIDPRMLTDYIRMQMMGTTSLFNENSYADGSSAEASSATGTDFMQMLQMMMQQDVSASNGQALPDASFNSILNGYYGDTSMSPETLLPQTNVKSAASLLQSLQPLQGAFGSVFPVQSFNTNSVLSVSKSAPVKTALTGRASQYDQLIQNASAKHGVDASLVKAVIHAESTFRNEAVSHAGAKGLMQLMDRTAAALGVTNSFDPEQNINGGTKYLSQLLKRFKGEEAVALAAYNAGPSRVSRLGISNTTELREKFHLLPKETQRYVDKVLGFKEKYE
jgi:hypothetical protein